MKNKLIGVFLLLIGAIFLPTAFSELKDTLQTKTPTSVAFASFQNDLPEEGWFKITGAQLDLLETLYVEDNGGVGNIYVPARKAGSEPGTKEPIAVLVKVSDSQTRALVEKMVKADATDKTATEFFLQNAGNLQPKRDLQGTIAQGVDALDDKDKRALEAAENRLKEDFVILQEGITPSVGGRIFMVAFGLALCGAGVWMFFKKN